mmetsp:Transcript_26378/g.40325  ORF Transcript_26378/g.40325 Transcript_26378/m.40325 type:complete len:726 (+) Transcript_26378:421-2598(+)|eukprot:CAMPEP_0194093880 /NCGR_PEP_ID=MMETSP0149-20130528/51984_1 /TAXON_ID=122233 /ORGANISM="Chaetoceros debilis, Strain MM31A-1" /LENGTH=725 /DNA_ID=CAMNT_0038779343 /DNA_START=443 /DNA_END=2620 /DNA_ORIENTATION=-
MVGSLRGGSSSSAMVDNSPISTWSQRSTSSSVHSNNQLQTPNSNISSGGRQLKPHNSLPKVRRQNRVQVMTSTVKTTASDNRSKSSSRSSQRTRSRSQDNQFQIQHENMMSRQQFRTNTSRSLSRGRHQRHPSGSGPSSVSSKPKRERAGTAGSVSLYGSDSYESGNSSYVSRRSEQQHQQQHISVPTTIAKPNEMSIDSLQETASTVTRIVSELNKAMDQERRIAAITNACAEFDHWDTEKHNIELQLGCSNVLCLVLSMTDNEDEIRMICAALEMVYRASADAIRKTFQEVGPSVVPLLLKILERCELSLLKHAEVSILNISKVLLYFSRVSELRGDLAAHDGMLNALTRISTSSLTADARVLRVRVIANLSNSEENKLSIVRHDGLVESILKVAALDPSENAREYASASLMDLASSSKTQEEMTNNNRLLMTLVKLAVTDQNKETREYAVTAMQNLAFSKENRVRLVQFSDGVVIEALKKALSTDVNDKSRRRAAGALTNLACEETGELLSKHEGLLNILARVATQDKNSDVQKRSSLALTKIASSCPVDSANFEPLMAALVRTASSANSTGIPAVFRVKARDASRREDMARIPGLLDVLAEMSTAKMYTPKEKDNAMRAIMHLTNDSGNRKIMCNKVILKALVEASNVDTASNKDTRDSAVVAIERLATEISNRQYMARHEGLLVVIAKATERESKADLAGEKQSQPRLAKQLLMSLLLAM